MSSHDICEGLLKAALSLVEKEQRRVSELELEVKHLEAKVAKGVSERVHLQREIKCLKEEIRELEERCDDDDWDRDNCY